MAGVDFCEQRGCFREAEIGISEAIPQLEGATGGRAREVGRQAGNGVKQLALGVAGGDGFQKRAGVGVQRLAKKIGFGGAFDDPSGIHHVDVVAHFGNDGEIVGDENHGGAELFLAVANEVENLLLHGHVKCGGRLVADEKLGPGDEGHGDHHALAHAAGKFVGVAVNAFFRLGDADFRECVDGAVECGLAGAIFVQRKRFGELGTHFHERVERGHRVLENHRDPLATDLAELFLGNFQEIQAVEHRLPAVDAAGRLGDEAEQ